MMSVCEPAVAKGGCNVPSGAASTQERIMSVTSTIPSVGKDLTDAGLFLAAPDVDRLADEALTPRGGRRPTPKVTSSVAGYLGRIAW